MNPSKKDHKPKNIFKNDGSFLELFKKMQKQPESLNDSNSGESCVDRTGKLSQHSSKPTSSSTVSDSQDSSCGPGTSKPVPVVRMPIKACPTSVYVLHILQLCGFFLFSCQSRAPDFPQLLVLTLA